MQAIRIDPSDNVAVAVEPIAAGEVVELPGCWVTARHDIAQGHKIALVDLPAETSVIKYGQPIGCCTKDVATGDWVHTHNMATDLSGPLTYSYEPAFHELAARPPELFQGFRRSNGTVGVRNEVWIIPTVACACGIGRELAARAQHLVHGGIDALRCYEHPLGCSQAGEDLEQTGRLLAGLVRHPSAGAVLVLSLGCEELNLERFMRQLGSYDEDRVAFLVCQDECDEIGAALGTLERLCERAAEDKREAAPVSELVVGLQCGGSDGMSGITANPVIGRVSDRLIARGGTSVLTEVPEMFGAEAFLLNRCRDRSTFEKAVVMINRFKEYFLSNGTPIYDNPSPGNKAGGITTLEDKSCGCVQKGGTAPVSDVVARHGDPVRGPGLLLYNTPGNDSVSTTALAAAGCHMILFSTGRGTPLEAPVPTLKVSSNTVLAQRKPGWIDFDAGVVASGERTIDEAGDDLFRLMMEIASGTRTKSEERGLQSIAIWKKGITL